MRYSESDAGTATAAGHADWIGDVVVEEPAWRVLPRHAAAGAAEPRVMATRWHAAGGSVRECDSETAADRHVMKIVLRTMNIRLAVDGRTVQDGVVTPGMFHVTGPGAPVCCRFRGQYDVLHLHVPNDLIDECGRDVAGGSAAAPGAVAGLGAMAGLGKDPMVEGLARALLDADLVSGSLGRIYADCIGVAIVARLLAHGQRADAGAKGKPAALANWRLRRAIEFVESRLGEPVSLAEVAAAAGLTRMHFAAQFRAATGLRPHEYLLRRRVERAQELLADDRRSVVDVALSVGFQTQAHFTTVFKRFAGQPPRAWRVSTGYGTAPAGIGA